MAPRRPFRCTGIARIAEVERPDSLTGKGHSVDGDDSAASQTVSPEANEGTALRFSWTHLLVVASMTTTLGANGATGRDLSDWFYTATAAHQSGTAAATTKPDFLPGKTMRSMHCGDAGVAIGGGIWQLVKYDRKHGIGLAVASTDQCSVSVFKASPPGLTVPDGDLSQASTGRGVRICTQPPFPAPACRIRIRESTTPNR
jgi:hypothetical protein